MSFYPANEEGCMFRFAVIVGLIITLSFATLAQRGTPARKLNPEGQPRGMGKGSTHRYLIWHDNQGWHLRTTTAREKHRFHGELVVEEGRLTDLRTIDREGRDWVQIAPGSGRIFFDLRTDADFDGFDFRSDAEKIRFRLFMDGKESPEQVYVGLTAANPTEIPFALVNPDFKSKPKITPLPPIDRISPIGKPTGMGAGSSQRYIIWRESSGLWHLRTTTGRKQHSFNGEIEAEDGRIYEMRTVRAEKKDWATIDKQKRIVFDLVTNGAIDGFDFRTDAKSLKFRLNIDGEARTDNVYIGEKASNPPGMPFILETK